MECIFSILNKRHFCSNMRKSPPSHQHNVQLYDEGKQKGGLYCWRNTLSIKTRANPRHLLVKGKYREKYRPSSFPPPSLMKSFIKTFIYGRPILSGKTGGQPIANIPSSLLLATERNLDFGVSIAQPAWYWEGVENISISLKKSIKLSQFQNQPSSMPCRKALRKGIREVESDCWYFLT